MYALPQPPSPHEVRSSFAIHGPFRAPRYKGEIRDFDGDSDVVPSPCQTAENRARGPLDTFTPWYPRKENLPPIGDKAPQHAAFFTWMCSLFPFIWLGQAKAIRSCAAHCQHLLNKYGLYTAKYGRGWVTIQIPPFLFAVEAFTLPKPEIRNSQVEDLYPVKRSCYSQFGELVNYCNLPCLAAGR